jgi:hypothetical protein
VSASGHSALQFLSFELSEDTDGVCTLDAEASTAPDQAPAVMAEVHQVLEWARQRFAASEGPLDEGHDWQHEVHTRTEAGRDHDWHTVALTLSASPRFVDAFRRRFGANLADA